MSVRAMTLVALTAFTLPAVAGTCAFQQWQAFKGTELRRLADGSAYYYTTSHSRIDADGAPNAYHPDDIGKNCIRDPHLGLDCPENAGYGRQKASWWSSVLTPDPQNPDVAYVQASGPTAGFFVSSTWLSDTGMPGTNPAKYVDATTVPYLVFPGSKFAALAGTGSKGDVGIAWNLNSGKSVAFIVADQGGGPDASLGEGSIALYAGLGGTNINARTGSGVAPGDMRFIIFPGSRKLVPKVWPRSAVDIDLQAKSLFATIGSDGVFDGCD